MIETTNQEVKYSPEVESSNGFLTPQFFLKALVLNWQWFLLSVIICVGMAAVYLRYTAPVYQINAKMLIKDDQNNKRPSANKLQNISNLGFMTNSEGFDNEVEVLQSVSVAEGAIRDLKLYVSYMGEGIVVDRPLYEDCPLVVDMDKAHLDKLEDMVALEIEQTEGKAYEIKGSYKVEEEKGGNKVKREFTRKGSLPMTVKTAVGTITISANLENSYYWKKGRSVKVSIHNPTDVARAYAASIGVAPLSKTTTIADITINDVVPQRAIDYLSQLAVVYNRQANEDKNEVAVRTEQFINQRIEKINVELGKTDGAIETFKRNNNMIDVEKSAELHVRNTDETDKRMIEINTQILLLQSIKEYMSMPSNRYQTLPSNVGLTDNAATSLISDYNKIVLERNRLMRSASEISPQVQILTNQLDDLTASINRAIEQSNKNLSIQRDAILRQNASYSSRLTNAPQQERILTEIGRQQTVTSGLYLMLLEKREENSISLAATADKGKMLDEPVNLGKIKPKKAMVGLIALILGIAIPFLLIVLLEMLRFRIEGHADVASLTKCPIIADIATANEAIKERGDIVVHANRNNQMEEIFRGMRTNLQFILKENENVIMFTSSTSGEGKTFTAANLAVSFALLGKKVLLVGLDIRRPRLSTLFDIDTMDNGISTLLTKDNVTTDMIKSQIVNSEVNKNLDILAAGPVPPNPSELVARHTLEDIFEVLRKEYDYVIVDTAPVGLVTDTLQIGRVCDVTVVMCRADYTEKSAFSMINDFAASKKLPNICIAINGIDMSKKKYGYAYGYGKYGKYGKYGSSTYGYGSYGNYGYHSYGYGSYSSSHYGNPNDNSIKK